MRINGPLDEFPVTLPLQVNPTTKKLELDLSTLANIWSVDPGADEVLLRKTLDNSLNRLRLDYIPPLQPYAAWNWLFEDFLNNGGFAGGLASGVSGTSAALNVGTGEANAPGVLSFTTGTTATGRAGLQTGATSLLLGQGKCVFEARVRIPTLSNATDTFTVYLGYGDLLTGNPTDGAFFRYTHGTNSGNWQGVCRSNNTESITNFTTAPVTTGWQKLNLNVYADGSRVDFTIGGTILAVTTNIPTVAGRETGIIANLVKSVGTTARTMLLDYLYHTFNLTTPR
jgi:hypothetical protein